MTVDVREPTVAGAVSGLGWRAQRLARRPALVNPTVEKFQLKIMGDTQTVSTGDNKLVFLIEEDMGALSLIHAHAYVTTVSSSGLVTVQIRNVTQTADMLTTKITIDQSEFSSYFAATQPVIDTANDDVDVGDRIAIDVDVAGTGAKGLGVILWFGVPPA